MNIVVVVFWQG